MYNHRLDTFLKAAELGSFSEAARRLYISPSAVIQQIGALERELGVRLFDRTSQGVQLTRAGEILRQHAQRMIEEERALRRELQAFQCAPAEKCRLQADILHKPRYFYRAWEVYGTGAEVEVVDAEWKRICEGADVMEGVLDGEIWQRNMAFEPLFDTPVAIAVPPGNALLSRESLTMEALRGQTLYTIQKGMSPILDDFARQAALHGVRVRTVPAYSMAVISRAQAERALLQIPACWSDLCPGLRTLRGDWAHALPYGFFFRAGSAAIGMYRRMHGAPREELRAALGIGGEAEGEGR